MNGVDTAAYLEELLGVAYPCSEQDFWDIEVVPRLSPGCVAGLAAEWPRSGLFIQYIVQRLGLAPRVGVSSAGVTVDIPADVVKWRQFEGARQALNTLLLRGFNAAQVSTDCQRMWGGGYAAEDVAIYRDLFFDVSQITHETWHLFEQTTPDTEKRMLELRDAPHDYVRWVVGVPLELDDERVVNRLISDAYFRLQTLQAEIGREGQLSKEQREVSKQLLSTIKDFTNIQIKLRAAAKNATSGSALHEELRKELEQIRVESLPAVNVCLADIGYIPGTIGEAEKARLAGASAPLA